MKANLKAMVGTQGPLSLQIIISLHQHLLQDRHHLQPVCLSPNLKLRGAKHLLVEGVRNRGRTSLNTLSVADIMWENTLGGARAQFAFNVVKRATI